MRTDARNNGELRPVAVFDYDGTCINGQSGSLIAQWLTKEGYLSMRTFAALAWWGIRYKLHLPYRHEEARELIFRDLGVRGQHQVEQIMQQFHDEVLVPRYRPLAIDEIALRKTEGCTTVLVSATFDAIARRAAEYLGADGFVATAMETDESGHYTGNVLGDVIEGDAKVLVTYRWADDHLGKGSWSLEYAYGDHHTDIELLAAAHHPVAVSPGPTLKRASRRNGWPIANWKS